jgi:hypothetical protein
LTMTSTSVCSSRSPSRISIVAMAKIGTSRFAGARL